MGDFEELAEEYERRAAYCLSEADAALPTEGRSCGKAWRWNSCGSPSTSWRFES